MRPGLDFIGVSAGAVIRNKADTYFLAKRGAMARDDQSLWEFPGGSVKLFEARETAVVRIIREKYGFAVAVISLLGVYEVIDTSQKDHWLSTTYLCEYVSGEPLIADTEKCEAIQWFDYSKLQHLDVSRITRLNMQDLVNRGRV